MTTGCDVARLYVHSGIVVQVPIELASREQRAGEQSVSGEIFAPMNTALTAARRFGQLMEETSIQMVLICLPALAMSARSRKPTASSDALLLPPQPLPGTHLRDFRYHRKPK